jgi:hypothetical protein
LSHALKEESGDESQAWGGSKLLETLLQHKLDDWLVRANRRVHATLRCRPIDRFEEDKAAMTSLTAVLPDTAIRLPTREARDHWVRVGGNAITIDSNASARTPVGAAQA